MSSSVMGMDSSGLDQACYFLRDKIYSDKILAVIREYVCNALDEHIKYKVDRAVDFGLRGDGEIEFFVRDYAKGLSEQEIRNVFGMYFKSTKRDNNIQSGSFGLGAKSAHAYTDTFYVKSHHNGVCTLYVCALGGGNTGVPVGHILKVSEEETSESGLEVYLSIKSGDKYSFNGKCQDFISFCSQKINYHYFNEVRVPETPVATVSKNGFIFRFFNWPVGSHYSFVKFCMGDVVYETVDFRHKKGHLFKKCLIIDIPIGKMSLPISRESFENTPSNQRVKAEIEQTLNEIIDEDISSIAPMTIEELLKTSEEPELKGKHFSVYKKTVYPDIYPFIRLHHSAGNGAQYEKHSNNKTICAVIKSSKTSYWHDKLNNLANKNCKKYYLIHQDVLNQCNISKLSESFEFRNVKSTIFNWPKTEGGKEDSLMNEARLVSIKSQYNTHDSYRYTPLQTYNYLAKDFGLDEAKTIDEAVEKIAELSFNSIRKLNAFTVAKADSASNQDTTFTRSKGMQKALIELGFFDVESQEYKDKLAELQKEVKIEAQKQNVISSMNKKFLHVDLAKQIVEKAQKNIKFAKKAKCVFDQVSKENSIRGKIIKCIETASGYWYSNNPQLTRQELRQILRMK
jgi:hypothetical protein